MVDTLFLEKVFSEHGWLSKQPTAQRRMFINLCRDADFEIGEAVVNSGDDPGGIYGVVSGSIGCEGVTELSGPTLGHILRPGAWFGMGPLLSGGRRTMTFRAMEKTTLLLAPLSQIRPLIATDLTFARMVGQLSEGAAQLGMQIACELLIKDAQRRVAATLLRVTAVLEGIAPTSSLGYRVSQQEIGEMSAISRVHANRVLLSLQARGFIDVSYGHIKIISPHELAEFVRDSG